MEKNSKDNILVSDGKVMIDVNKYIDFVRNKIYLDEVIGQLEHLNQSISDFLKDLRERKEKEDNEVKNV